MPEEQLREREDIRGREDRSHIDYTCIFLRSKGGPVFLGQGEGVGLSLTQDISFPFFHHENFSNECSLAMLLAGRTVDTSPARRIFGPRFSSKHASLTSRCKSSRNK